MQYLVSVISDGTEVDSPEVGTAIDAFNDRLQAEGYWVFGNGLAAPSAATVVDNRGDAAGLHRWAVPRVEGTPRRLLDSGGDRPRRYAPTRRRGVEGLRPPDRGPAIPRVRRRGVIESPGGRAERRRQETNRDGAIPDFIR